MLNAWNLQFSYLQKLENLSVSWKSFQLNGGKKQKKFFYSYNLKYIQNSSFTAAKTFNPKFRTVVSGAEPSGHIPAPVPTEEERRPRPRHEGARSCRRVSLPGAHGLGPGDYVYFICSRTHTHNSKGRVNGRRAFNICEACQEVRLPTTRITRWPARDSRYQSALLRDINSVFEWQGSSSDTAPHQTSGKHCAITMRVERLSSRENYVIRLR